MNFKKPTHISEIVKALGPLIDASLGDIEASVDVFSPLDQVTDTSFIFVGNKKFMEAAQESSAKCVLVHSQFKDLIEKDPGTKTWLFSRNVDLAARQIKQNFVFQTPFRNSQSGIHPTAVIAESCELGKDVTVGPYAIINSGCKIGDNSFIGANTYVEENVTIGNNTTLHPLVYIGHSCEIGNNCEIMPQSTIGSEGFGYSHDHLGNHYRIPHTGRMIIEDDVHIGAGCAIDRGTLNDSKIGKGTKVDNQCHVAHNNVIGKNGLLTAQLVTAGSTTIGDNFICGGKTAVAGHITVTDNVNVAALSGIAKSVDKPGAYGGYPLEPLKDFLRTRKSMTHVTEIRRQMSKVMKKVFPEEN